MVGSASVCARVSHSSSHDTTTKALDRDDRAGTIFQHTHIVQNNKMNSAFSPPVQVQKHANIVHEVYTIYVLFDVTLYLVDYHVPFPSDFVDPDLKHSKKILSGWPDRIVGGNLASRKRIWPPRR